MTQSVDQQIELVKKNTGSALSAAQKLSITNKEELNTAAELLTKINRAGDQLKKVKDSIIKPLNEGLKNARLLFSEPEKNYEEAKNMVQFKIMEYDEKIRKEREKESKKIEQKVESGKMSIETAAKKSEKLPEVQKTILTDTGKLTFREDRKMKIIDQNLVPDEYWVIDEVKLRKVVLAGLEVPGTTIETVRVPVNSR